MQRDLRRIVVYVGCAIITTFAVGELFGIKVLNAAWGTLLGTMISGAIVAGAVEKLTKEASDDGKRDDQPGKPKKAPNPPNLRDPAKVVDRRPRRDGRSDRVRVLPV